MIRITGPGVNTESQGLNNGMLNWILGELDRAYEAGLGDVVNESVKLVGSFTTGKPASAPEAINPDHYKVGGIECIDYLRAKLTPEEFQGFLKGNAMKYLSRSEHKGGAEDLKKAAWYTSMLSGKDPRAEVATPHQPSIR